MGMDHKSTRSKSRQHLTIWVSLFVIYTLLFTYRASNTGLAIATAVVFTLVSASTIFAASFRLIPRHFDKGRGLKFSISLLAWLFFDAFFVMFLLNIVIGFWPGVDASDTEGSLSNTAMVIAFMWLVVITWVIIIIAKKQQDKDLDASKLQTQLAESEAERKALELDQLKAQLQPHFLFNTLNTIYGASLQKADHVPDMIMELSAMLDYGLYQAAKDQVPLVDEVAHLERYLNLEEKRFRDGLKIEFIKKGDLSTTSLPPLLLMPLVENAIKHGKVLGGILGISIDLKLHNGELTFSVKNAVKNSETSRGIGLENLRKRLKSLFPEKHRLLIEQKDDTFTATLTLSLKEA